MVTTILAILLTFFGALLFPMFTLGCVLVHYGHTILGIILIVISIIVGLSKFVSDERD